MNLKERQQLLETELPVDYKEKLVVLVCENYPASNGVFGYDYMRREYFYSSVPVDKIEVGKRYNVKCLTGKNFGKTYQMRCWSDNTLEVFDGYNEFTASMNASQTEINKHYFSTVAELNKFAEQINKHNMELGRVKAIRQAREGLFDF